MSKVEDEMKYHMEFTLGDPSADGHGLKEEWHIVANHSAKEIEEAVQKFQDETNFHIKRWAEEYEDNRLPEEDVDDLEKLGFITDAENIPGTDNWDGEISFDGGMGYVTFIFEVIVKHYIPDFRWSTYNIPNELTLNCMDGNGYGLFCL